jgi:hypothetical protein
MQNGVQLVNIRTPKEITGDIKMQRRKIGAVFNDQIGITPRIGYKFVGFDDSTFDGDFNGFVRSDLAI